MGRWTPPLPLQKTQTRHLEILLWHFYFNTLPVEMSSEVAKPMELDIFHETVFHPKPKDALRRASLRLQIPRRS